MNLIDFILELLRAVLPFCLSLATVYVIIRIIYDNEQDKRNVDYNLRIQELAHAKQQEEQTTNTAAEKGEVLGIRLQAYERLVLFLERINPQSLILRVRQDEMTAPELQMALLINIRTEFEHNITQQLYVSPMVWNLMSTSVEELITVISAVARQMPTDASGLDLSRAILQYFLTNDHTLALHQALEELKKEAQQLF
jgi:hypothetical protein